MTMSETEGGQSFKKRLQDTFSALDCHTPNYISATRGHVTGTTQDDRLQQQLRKERKRKRLDDDIPHPIAHPPPWHVRLDEPGQTDETVSRQCCSEHHQSGFSTRREQYPSRSVRGLRPFIPAHVPGYLSNPEKWTRYSLSEDGTSGMQGLNADQVNAHAAFQFLKELEGRKASVCDYSGSADRVGVDSTRASRKVGFRTQVSKPRTSTQRQTGMTDGVQRSLSPPHVSHEDFGTSNYSNGGRGDSVLGGSGVFRMPEYVVGGQKKKRCKHTRRQALGKERNEDGGGDGDNARTVVNLSHLAEEEEEN